VLVSSFPYTINWTQEHVPAIVLMTHNSQESGNALADVLFGDFDPAGRLVHTWPRSIDQLPPMMDYDIRHGHTYMYFNGRPLYAFGFGLSYTRFRYSGLRTDSPTLPADGSIDIRMNVSNVGARDGEEVVQLYTQLPDSKVPRPRLTLQGFRRIAIKAGDTQELHFTLAARQLAYWDEATHRYIVEPGKVRLLAGASSSDIRLTRTITTSGTFALGPDLRPAALDNGTSD
jgi:beta-glucosidase